MTDTYQSWLSSLKVGDRVIRWLAGTIPMDLLITEVVAGRIICGSWEFDQRTGMEVDDTLEWGPIYGRTGSYIKPQLIEQDRKDGEA